MADYKIQLGILLENDDIQRVRTKINELEKDPIKIRLDDTLIDSKVKEIRQQLASLGKTDGLKLDTKTLEASLDRVAADIKEIRNAFGTLDSKSKMGNLLTSINQISVALDKASNQFVELNASLSSLSNKSFGFNFDFKMGNTNPVKAMTDYGREARKNTIPQLQEQAAYLQNLLGGYQKADAALERYLVKIHKANGITVKNNLIDDMANTSSINKQMEALERYITLMRKVASTKGVSLSGFDQTFTSSPDKLVEDTIQIQTGAKQAEESLAAMGNQLKQVFGSGIDAERLSAQLDDIVGDLKEIRNALQTLSQNSSLDGLTQSFNNLSASIEKLVGSATQAQNVLNNGLNTSGASAGTQKAIQEQNQLAEASTQTANVVSQSGAKVQQAFNQMAAASNLDPVNLKDDISEADEMSAAIIRLKQLIGSIGRIQIGQVNTSKGVQELQVLETQLESLSAEWNETVAEINANGGMSLPQLQGLRGQIESTTLKIEQLKKATIDAKTKFAKGIELKLESNKFSGQVQKVIADSKKLASITPELQRKIKELISAEGEMNSAFKSGNLEQKIAAYKKYEFALESVKNQLIENQAIEQQTNNAAALQQAKQNLSLKMSNWLRDNSAAAKQFGAEIQKLQVQLKNCGNTTGVQQVGKAFQNVALQAKEAGLTALSFGDRIKKQISQYSAYFSVYSVFMYAIQGLRSMFEQVKAIDSAMTELKKVTDETDSSYNRFLTNAASRAKELGTTIDGLVDSTADFARLGYSFEDSQGLAEVANIYAVVGDEIEGVEQATESLISTMAAFKEQQSELSNEDFAMEIIDKFNEIGNNFAISSGGIGDALTRSASSLAAANNTLDESIALITAANTVVQDPEQVGTAFKTISMRIRGAKTELEEAGLETDGMVESTAKLRSEILALTGVDIMDGANQFKSTYAIMDELAAKWQDLTDIQQATVTELIAGKRQGNIVSSLMSNFDTARDALETSLNSSGSAMQEHEKWMESLEARLNKLKATWQSLSQSFMSSDFLKGALDAVVGFVNGLDVLIDKFGTLPTLIGAFAGGMSLFKNGGFFKVVTDELTGFATGITTTFGQVAQGVNQSLSTINLSKGFRGLLTENDVKSLRAYSNALDHGVSKATAWNNCMVNTSSVAQEAAQSNEFLSKGLDGYLKSQQAATVSTLAQNKSLGSAKSLINEYSNGCKTSGMSQKQFANAVKTTNPELAKAMTTTKSARSAMASYTVSTIAGKAATLALKVGIMALNMALTMGVSALVTFIIDGIGKLIKTSSELSEEVEELTSKFKEQHNELKKLKSDYDTTNETSMISKYKKLSKGVDSFGKNIALTADEYSEYQSIVSSIAEQFPSLVSGYDEQGNAILSCKSNVEQLTEAYEKLIHAQNQEILTNTKDIEKDFSNTLKNADSHGFWKTVGTGLGFSSFMDYDITTDTVKHLEGVLNSDANELNKLKKSIYNTYELGEIRTALENAGIEVGFLEDPIEVLEETLKTDPSKIKGIVDDYYTQFADAIEEQKTIAQAKLSEAFDISSTISGLNYGDINEELQTIAQQTVSNLDFDFFTELQEQGKTVEQWTTELLDQLNAIGKINNTEVKTAFELQTKFNSGEISYGEYIKGLKNFESLIDGWNLKSEAKEQLKISVGLDDNGIVDQYDALLKRLTSKEIGLDDKATKNFLNSLSAEELDILVDIVPNLDAGTTISEIQKLINEQLAEEFTFDITVQTEGIEAFNTALEEARSATGLTAESISALKSRYEDLDGFNAGALFERTANGVRVNNEELARLEAQYENVNKLDIKKNLNTLIGKYKDLTEKIKICTDAQEKETLQAQADAYADKIEDLRILESQYEGLTSAFSKWQTAQESVNDGDNYDSLYESLEDLEELYKNGLVGTDDFKTSVQLMSNEDLSTASVDEYVSAYKKGISKIKRYFTEGQKGCKNFLNDLNKVNSEWAHKNENGDWEINIDVEEAAQELGMSVDAIYLILDKLKDYGFEINIDDSSVENLQTEIEKTEAKVKELGQTPISVDLDTTDIKTIDSEINKIKTHITEINNSSVSVETKNAQLDDAKAKLEALIQKKQEVSQPAFMNLNTSQVNASLVDALEKVQAYQNAINEVNKLSELKEAGITIDDSELKTAKEKVDECAKAIQGLDGEVKVAIGLEEDGSVDSIKKAFEEGKVKIDANTDPALTKIELLAENVERIEDKDVTINVTVNGLEDVKELNKNIDLATNIDGDVDALSKYVESAKVLNDLDDNIASFVTAQVNGNVKDAAYYELENIGIFAEVAKELEDVGSFSRKVVADVEGNVISTPEYAINNLKVFSDSAKDIDEVGNVESSVVANIDGNVIDTEEYKINNLETYADSAKDVYKIGNVESSVTATVNTGNDGDVVDTFEYKLDNLGEFATHVKALQGLDDVDISVTATVNSGEDGDVIDEFEYKLDNLEKFASHVTKLQGLPKETEVDVKATVNTGNDGDVIEEFEYKLDNLEKFADHVSKLQGLPKETNVSVTATVNSGEDGDVIDEFEYKLDNLEKFASHVSELQGLEDVDISVNATVNTGNDGDVIEEFEYKLDNLGEFAKHAKELQGLEDVEVNVIATVNSGEDGDVIDEFEYKLNNLSKFAEHVQELQGLNDVDISINAKVNTGEDGDVIDEFEYKLDNLGEFASHVKDLQGLESVDISVNATVNTGDDGDVVDEFEHKLNNLETFADGVKALQNLDDVDITVDAKINTGEDGDVIDEFEYKLNNLGTFADGVKSLQELDDVDITVSAKVNTGESGDAIDVFEHKLNNLGVFAEGAKSLQNVGDASSTITAKINTKAGESDATDIGMFESRLNNLKAFAEGAKSLQGVEDVSTTVTAKINTKVGESDATDLTMFKGRLEKLKTFAESAKTLQGVGNPSSTITAKIKTGEGVDAINRTDAQINRIKVFAESAKALKGVGDPSSTVTAKMSGNAITGENVSTNLSSLTEFKSLVEGMSNQTVTVSVTANVDSENINQAITLLKSVSDSGLFKDYKATVQVGAKIATIDDTTVKNYKAPQKEGTVEYIVDSSKVDVWNAPSKDGVVNYSAEVEALTDSQKHKKGTITYDVKISGFPIVNGTANVNGTAFANGTSGKAYRQGDWGAKRTETALTGELGPELVVYRNRYWTVGDNGAEFTTIPKGAIVFNHKQTEELFKNGRVTSDGGRGRAFIEGTAYNDATGGGGFTGEDSSSSSSSDKFEETIDWIETILDRAERAIDKYEKQADNVYNSWSSRNKALNNQISEVGNTISTYESARDKYLSEANKVGLNETYAAKVRNGSLNVEDFEGSSDEALVEKIKKYQDLYEKYLDCEDAIEELKITEYDLHKQSFDNIITRYDGILDDIEHEKSMIEESISQYENTVLSSHIAYSAEDYDKLAEYYQDLINQEAEIIEQLELKKIELMEKLNSGVIPEGTEAWDEMQAKINDVDLAIQQANTSITEFGNNIAQSFKDAFDKIAKDFDYKLSVIEHKKNMIEESIAQSEARGWLVSGEYYEALIGIEQGNLAELQAKQTNLLSKLQSGLDSDGNPIQEDSDDWNEMCAEIDETTLAIEQSKTALLEYQQTLQQLDWESFELLQERISAVTEEADFLIDLMGHKKLHDDNGRLTSEGLATIGLHGQNYNTYMYQADEYADKVAELNREIENDPYDQELISKRDEYLGLQRDCILAAEDEKDAIKDLVEEGIELELDALQERIDLYSEALDSQKDLYDYQKKVKEQTKEIASLEKQMAAYQGDDSEEAKAKIQELKVSLEEAKADLEETEYEKYISDQKQILDDLYLEYETILNERLDNVDALISSMIDEINSNSGAIASTIYSSAEQVGYTMSEEMQSIWEEAYQNEQLDAEKRVEQVTAIINQLVANGTLSQEDANRIISTLENGDWQSVQNTLDLINQLVANGDLAQEDALKITSALSVSDANNRDIVAEYTKDFDSKMTTTNTTLSNIKYGIDAMISQLNTIANTQIQAAKASSATTTAKATGTTTTVTPTTTAKVNTSTGNTKADTKDDAKDNTSTGDGILKIGDKVTFVSGKYYYDPQGATPLGAKNLGKQVYITNINKNSWATHPIHISTGNKLGKGDLGWLKKSQINGYAIGKQNFLEDEIAWTQEGRKQEFIVRPSDGAILTPIAKGDSVLNAQASGNIWNMANSPAEFIKDNLNLGTANVPTGSNAQSVYMQNLDKVVFNLPNVKNYEELLAEMQKDKNFERLITSMSIDRLAGKSSLAKGKAIR